MNKNEFPTVEELSNGFSEFKLETAKDLVSKTLELNFENGLKAVYKFLSEDCIEVEYLKDNEMKKYSSIYSIVSPREGIYLVDFIEHRERPYSVTTVIDLKKEIATRMQATLPTKEEADVSQLVRAKEKMPMTSVKAEFMHAAISKEFNENTEIHPFTKELIGEKIKFRYSSNDEYEHYYLNENFYTWHCVKGIEKNLCDTDLCYFIKLDEKLYWFTWLEKVVPTIGTVVEDLSENVMRSYGKISGYDSYDHGEITNFQVGSYATRL